MNDHFRAQIGDWSQRICTSEFGVAQQQQQQRDPWPEPEPEPDPGRDYSLSSSPDDDASASRLPFSPSKGQACLELASSSEFVRASSSPSPLSFTLPACVWHGVDGRWQDRLAARRSSLHCRDPFPPCSSLLRIPASNLLEEIAAYLFVLSLCSLSRDYWDMAWHGMRAGSSSWRQSFWLPKMWHLMKFPPVWSPLRRVCWLCRGSWSLSFFASVSNNFTRTVRVYVCSSWLQSL